MYTIDTTTESINSTAGIALIGKIAEKIQLFTGKNQGNTINYDEIIRCMYGLICQGRFSFEELALFSNDPLFKDALHIKSIPSPVTKSKSFRKRLRKVISDLIFVSCKIVKRSRKIFIMLWNKNTWYKAFKNVYELVSAW